MKSFVWRRRNHQFVITKAKDDEKLSFRKQPRAWMSNIMQCSSIKISVTDSFSFGCIWSLICKYFISNINFQRSKFSHKVGNTVNSASRIQSNWLHLFLCEDLLGSRSTLYMTTTLLQDMKTPVAAKIDATALLYYCIEVCIKNDIFSSSWVVNSMQNYFFSCWRWLKFRRKKTYY